MKLWRLLVEIGPEVWTYVVAAPDHTRAWQVLAQSLTERDRELAFLEELAAVHTLRSVRGPSRVMQAWRSAPVGRRA